MQWIGTTAALALALLAQHRLARGASHLEVGALFLAGVGLAILYFPRWEAESVSAKGRPTSSGVLHHKKGGDRPPQGGEGVRERSFPGKEELARRIRRWLLVTAWLAQAGALVLAASGRGWPWDGLLWGLSLLAFLGELLDRDWWKSLGPFAWKEILALGAVLALALFSRVYHLGHLPPTIHGDEAQFGLNARAILYGEQPTLFAVGWYQFPIASFAAQAGVMSLFGDDMAGLRLSSALFGVLTLLPVYLLARSMFDQRVALASAALMAVGHWPVHFSRLGINNIQATFFAAWAVYLAWRALRTGHLLNYALAGLALGLGLYTYYAARLMPFIVGAMLGLAAWRNRSQWRQHLPGLLALVIAATLAVAPQAVYFAIHPEPLVSRQRGVFLFNNLPHLESAYHTDDWGEILRQQTVRSLLVFNARGDTSGQYGFDEPMLDRLTAGLMVVGLGLSAWRWRRGGHWVLHLWFWPHLLLGSVLTVDAPFVPRLVALMPVPFIWAGAALGGWWRQVTPRPAYYGSNSSAAPTGPGESLPTELGNPDRRQAMVVRRAPRELLPSIPVIALLILIGWTNYDAYINRYLQHRRTGSDSTRAAHLLATLPQSTQVYLMGTPNIYAGFGTFRFEAPNATVWDAVNVSDWAPVRQPDPPDALFLLWPSHMDRLPYLQTVYPEGDYQTYLDQNRQPMFATYLVPSQIIRQRQGLRAYIYPSIQREGEPLGQIHPPAPSSSPLEEERKKNIVWRGTFWLPDDGAFQLCLQPELPDEANGAYLQIDGNRIEIPGSHKSCDSLALTFDLPAGPHPIEMGAMTAHEETKAMRLYWSRKGETWEEVPPHLLWDKPWFGGLLGVYGREGVPLRREIAPLIAYRDFHRELVDPVQASWTGCLVVDKSGEYEFRVRSFDGARLIVDGQPLIEDEHRKELREGVARAELAYGDHRIRLEALFTDGPRWLEWYWRPPGAGNEWALVPPEVLAPSPDCAEKKK